MSDDDSVPAIVVNDLLSFMSFKRKECSKEKLLNCVRKFYPSDEAVQAYQILLSSLPEKRTYLKLQTNEASADPFLAIYEAFVYILEDDLAMFVCRDLNNVPTVDKEIKINDAQKSAIRKEHRVIKNQINEVFQTLYQLKEEVQIISENTYKNGYQSYKETGLEDSDDDDDDSDRISDIADARGSYDEDPDETSEEDKARSESPLVTQIKQELDTTMVLGVEPNCLLEEEDNCADRTSYYSIKHVFDDYIGYFSIMICSECHFYSNDEDTLAQHQCHMTPIEYGLQQSGIWDELDFERAKQIEKEEKLREKQMKQLKIKQEAAEKKQKQSEIFDKNQRCPLCGDKFPVPEWLEHVRFCMGNGTTIPQNHYCSVCDVFYADFSTLKIHQGYHDESRPYECLQCKFRFLTQADVDRHFNKHIPEKVMKSKCPFCPFPVLRKSSLTEHIKSHTGDRPYECKICGAKFTNRVKLRKHLNIHNRREYPCDLCAKVFKSQATLQIHRQYHLAEKPFKCPICNKGFVDNKAMNRHQRKHMEEFSCPHCNFRAKSSQTLKEHVEKHNNCMLCDFKTTHKNIYLKHMMDHHPEALLSD